jgi:hypothetical protein
VALLVGFIGPTDEYAIDIAAWDIFFGLARWGRHSLRVRDACRSRDQFTRLS